MADGSVAWDIIARDKASAAFDKVSKSAASSSSGIVGQLKNMTSASLGAGSGLSALGGASGGATTAIAAIGAAVAATAATVSHAVDTYVELTDSVRKFAEQTGTTAEEASRFVAVADDYGISAETAAKSVFFLARTAETNSKGLAALGVEVQRTASGQLDLAATVQEVADAYAATSDPGQRAELVMAALGRTGKELIPLLKDGGAGLREMFADVPGGQIMSDADLQQALNFKLAMDDAHDSVMELELALAENVVPALAAFGRAAAPIVRDIGTGMERTLFAIRAVVEGMRNPTELLDWDGFIDKLNASAESTTALGSAQDDAADAADRLASAQMGIFDAALRNAGAQRGIETGLDRVREAQTAVSDAWTRGGKHAKELADATENLTRTQQGLVDAQRRVRDLTEEVGDRQRATAEAADLYGANSNEAVKAAREERNAQEDLADAHAAVKDKVGDVADAQQKVADARDLGPERIQAAKDLADANFDLEQKVLAAAGAAVKLNVEQQALNGVEVSVAQQAALTRDALLWLTAPLPKDALNDLTALQQAAGGRPAGTPSAAGDLFRAGERNRYGGIETLGIVRDPGPAATGPAVHIDAVHVNGEGLGPENTIALMERKLGSTRAIAGGNN